METEIDYSDVEFEKLLAERSHKQLMSALKELVQAIRSNGYKNDELVAKIRELSSSSPVVNVDQGSVVSELKSLEKLCGEITDNQESIIEILRTRPTKLSVQRNSGGTIQFVNVEYNKIT